MEDTPQKSVDVSIKHMQEKIKQVERQIASNKVTKANLSYELEHMEKPVRKYTE
jgi:phage shock protein A